MISLFSERGREEQRFNSVKHRHSSDDGSIIKIFVQINIFEGRAGYVVLMGCVSVTISYSSRWLTTETVKYINENSFIENLAASKYSMWAQ